MPRKTITRKAINEARRKCHEIASRYFKRTYGAIPTLKSIDIVDYNYDDEKGKITHVIFESGVKDKDGFYWETKFNEFL